MLMKSNLVLTYDEDVEPDFGCIQCRSYNVHARAFSKSMHMQVLLKASCNCFTYIMITIIMMF